MDALSDDLVASILSYLPPAERCGAALVSRRFHSVSSSPAAWRRGALVLGVHDWKKKKAGPEVLAAVRRVGAAAAVSSAAAGELLARPCFEELEELRLYQFGEAPLAPVLAAAPRALRRLALLRGEAGMPRGPKAGDSDQEEPEDDDEELDEAVLRLAGASLGPLAALEELEVGRANAAELAAAAGAACPARRLLGRVVCEKAGDLAALRRAFPHVATAEAVLDGRGAPFLRRLPKAAPFPSAASAFDDEDEPEDFAAALKGCVQAGVRHLDIFTEANVSDLAGCLAGLRSLAFLYSESSSEELFKWMKDPASGLASLESLTLSSSAGLEDFGPEALLEALRTLPRLRRLRLLKPTRVEGWPAFFAGLAEACPALCELGPEDEEEWGRRLGSGRWAPCAGPYAALRRTLGARRPPPPEPPASPRPLPSGVKRGRESEDESEDEGEGDGSGSEGGKGPARRQRGGDDTDDEGEPKKPACQYGARCYRTNPEHLRDFSHPPRPAGQRPPCQYGAKCYRKNPDHLRDFFHPPK